MKETRENEKSQSVGKVRLIKGRNLPKEEGGLRMGVLEHQKSQEGSPERLENREEGKRRVKRLLKEI